MSEIEFIESKTNNGKTRRLYESDNRNEAIDFANKFNGSYVKIGGTYTIII